LLTIPIFLAVASTLASPIPADSFSKKDLAGIDSNILAREPETQGSGLDLLVREPSPICGENKMCT
jgi:hypothetical protein